MIPVSEDNISFKGRVGPGQMISLDLDKGKYYNDEKTKDHLSSNSIYKKFASNHIELSKSLNNIKEKNNFEGTELRQRQFMAGFTIEDLESILHPMIEDEKEAVGSMGDDTPIAVLSSKFRPLSNFFRQNFSQVTNPPIDSLRENRVMSLNTRFGNLENILDDRLTEQKSYVLESPVLSNSQFKKLFEIFGNETVQKIDISFDKDNKDLNLKSEVERIQKEAEICIRSGKKHLIISDENIPKIEFVYQLFLQWVPYNLI